MRNLLFPLPTFTMLCMSAAGPLPHPALAAPHQPPSSESMTPSERDAQAKLEHAGYTNIHNVRSGAEGITAIGTKDGREMSLVLDSYGNIRER